MPKLETSHFGIFRIKYDCVIELNNKNNIGNSIFIIYINKLK